MILLINPWIYDFAAYDLYCAPLGLLYIGAVLEEYGKEVKLINCTDRYHPALKNAPDYQVSSGKKDGTGKFIRTLVEKPEPLVHIPRNYARYGLPEQIVINELTGMERPEAVFVTSLMTYWYPGVQHVIRLVRSVWNNVLVVLGGIYATLFPDHALKNSGADIVITGEGETQIPGLLDGLGISHDRKKPYEYLDDYPFPALHLQSEVPYLPLLTSRGCPYRCSFCASHKVAGSFRQRNVYSVVEEVIRAKKLYDIKRIVFFDDALFYNKSNHILPILDRLIANVKNTELQTPNGINANEIDRETAEIMRKAGFKMIRLSLESTAKERERNISFKVSEELFSAAVENLNKAGYKRSELECYIIMGLPGQTRKEVTDTIQFAHGQGVKIRLASYSPIPGTRDWKTAIAKGLIDENMDVLLTNNTIVPLSQDKLSYTDIKELRDFAKNLNLTL